MALKKVGALWLKEKDGKKFMSGNMEFGVAAGAQVFVYNNDRKQSEKHPDYTLHVIEDDQPSPKDDYRQAPAGPPPDGDIPF
jgi:hypothetical protein